MNKNVESASIAQYIWICVKSLFLICLLILIISVFVMYFFMADSVAKILTFLSMLLGVAFCGYEAADVSKRAKKVLATVMSILISLILIGLSFIIKRKIDVSKYYMYLIIFGPILGFLMGVINSLKAIKPRSKRRR